MALKPSKEYTNIRRRELYRHSDTNKINFNFLISYLIMKQLKEIGNKNVHICTN